MPIANFCRRRYQPKRPPIANNRPGSPEFAQERDNRSKKARFIFREIGSIRATRLSPSPLPETGLVAAGLCSAETGRPFKEQLALTAMPDEHSVPGHLQQRTSYRNKLPESCDGLPVPQLY